MSGMSSTESRRVPSVEPLDRRLRMVIDTDAANEIDDLYAIALALKTPERFSIERFVATHFAARAGRESIQASHDDIALLLQTAGIDVPIHLGGDPLCYPGRPAESPGAQFIIEAAKSSSPDDPLFVLVLGAASNVASAILIEPAITDRMVVMFHGRSESTWPVRSTQFNIYGDIIAAGTLLESDVPLIWFDTGTQICASMEDTESRLAPLGPMGRHLHRIRHRNEWYQQADKGFFDLGDVAWLIDPAICSAQVVPAPSLTRWMYFDHTQTHGQMLFVSEIDPEATWRIFYERLGRDV